MSHMARKALLVNDFGVDKAKRATASLITNKIEDDGLINKDGRGARDQSILATAQKLDQDIQTSRKGHADDKAKKKAMYSRKGLLPDEILQTIAHKEIYQALQEYDEEYLKSSFNGFARISLQ